MMINVNGWIGKVQVNVGISGDDKDIAELLSDVAILIKSKEQESTEKSKEE